MRILRILLSTALTAASLFVLQRPAAAVCVTLVSSTADSGTGTLRAALACVTSGDVVTFDSSFNTAQTITLSSGALAVDKNLTITGPGAALLTIDGASSSSVISTTGVALNLSGVRIVNGSASRGGGIVAAGDVTLRDVEFANNSATDNGGGLYTSGSLTIEDSLIQGNTAGTMGAGFWLLGYLEMTNTQVLSNSAVTNGGGGLADGGGRIVGSTFQGNSASSSGGALMVQGGEWQIIDSTFEGNTSTNDGGALFLSDRAPTRPAAAKGLMRGSSDGHSVFVDESAHLRAAGAAGKDAPVDAAGSGEPVGYTLLQNVTFRGNHGNFGGGVSSIHALTLSHVSFIDNQANLFGGGVYANNGSLSISDRITATGNSADSGGAMLVSPPIAIPAGYFANNSALTSGGVLFANDEVRISNATVYANTSGGTSGAVHSQGAVMVTNTQFLSNSAQSLGGAINGDAVVLVGAVISGNVGALGGGVYGQTSVTAVDSSIQDNVSTAEAGGGLATSGALIISNTSVMNNRTAGAGGGAVGMNAIVRDSTFISNSAAVQAGGLFAFAADIDGARFERNASDQMAGGLFVVGTAAMTDVVILSNTAASYAGAAVVGGSVVSVVVQGNVATEYVGGLAVINGGELVLTDGRIVGNRASTAAALGVADASTMTVRSSTIDGNAATDDAAGTIVESYGFLAVENSTLNDNDAWAAVALSGTALLTNTTVFSTSGIGMMITGTAGTYNFANNLVAGNGGAACGTLGPTFDGSHNIADDDSCGFTTTAVRGAGVGAFGAHGGVRPTLALLPGSPALDVGDDATCPATDARGMSRVGTCDAGAYESRGFRMSITSGGVQTTSVKSAFAQPLVVTFASNGGEALGPGGILSITLPSAGAGVTPSVPIRAFSAANGAVTTTLTANAIAGRYAVTLTASGIVTALQTSYVNFVPSLTVITTGNGIGSVTGTPAGIDCGVTCTVEADSGEVMTLTATADPTSVFAGWTGECSGTSDCVVTITAVHRVTATFTLKSNDANLSGLALSAGVLTPAFLSSTTSYTAAVSYATTTEILTPTLSDAGATYSVTGAAGECAAGCALAVGDNLITVTVLASNGTTTKTYVVTVTRAAAPAPTPTATATATATATRTPTTPAATATRTPTTPAPTATATATRTPAATATATATRTPITPAPTATATATRTPAAPTLTAMWPRTGIPAGGMPVAVFGGGLAGATGVDVNGLPVTPYTVTSDGRIDFVMPPGVAGSTVSVTVRLASGDLTLAEAFRYEAQASGSVDAAAGGIVTTTSGVTLTVAALPVSGTVLVTLVPVAPPTTTQGSVLLYSFALSVTLDGKPLLSAANAVRVDYTVDGVPTIAGEQPWAFEQQADGTWALVGLQTYTPATGRLSTRAQAATNYVVTMARAFQQRMPYVRR